MTFVVFIVDPDTHLKTYIFSQTEVTIGRSPNNHIVLDEASVSKYHGRLISIDDTLFLSDLGSANGIIVNQKKITVQTVIFGSDSINIRGFQLTIRALTDSEEQQLSLDLDYIPSPPASVSHLKNTIVHSERQEAKEKSLPDPLLSQIRSEESLSGLHGNAQEDLEQASSEMLGQSTLNLKSSSIQVTQKQELFDQETSPQSPSYNSNNPIPNSVLEEINITPVGESTPPLNTQSKQVSTNLSAREQKADLIEPSHSIGLEHRKPNSLSSIFNVVNPLPKELLAEYAAQSLNTLHGELASSVGKAKDAVRRKSLHSIYNVVNPLPKDVIETEPSSSLGEVKPNSLNSIFNVINPFHPQLNAENGSSSTESSIDDSLRQIIGEDLAALLGKKDIIEINLNGFQNVTFKRQDHIDFEQVESPFIDFEQAEGITRSLLTALGYDNEKQGEGRIGSCWCYANLLIPNGPYLSICVIPPLSPTVINPRVLELLTVHFAQRANLLLVGPQPQVLCEFVAELLNQTAHKRKTALIGIKYILGDSPSWISLGTNDQALDHAVGLNVDRVVISDLPSLSGTKLCDILDWCRSSILIIPAPSLEEGVLHLRKKVLDDERISKAISHLGFIERNAEGQVQLTSMYSYPYAEELYRI
jgi:hypothetical protein